MRSLEGLLQLRARTLLDGVACLRSSVLELGGLARGALPGEFALGLVAVLAGRRLDAVRPLDCRLRSAISLLGTALRRHGDIQCLSS